MKARGREEKRKFVDVTRPTGSAAAQRVGFEEAVVDSQDDEREEAELRRIAAQLEDEDVLEAEGAGEEALAERLAAERRQRRAEILAKHADQSSAPESRVAESVVDLPPAVQEAVPPRRTATLESVDTKASAEPLLFDIFSSSPVDVYSRLHAETRGGAIEDDADKERYLESNWDDGEGYYKARIGEVIAERYQTLGVVGKGVFSTVLKCVDVRNSDADPVAVKLIRSNDVMKKAAEKELSILAEIAQHDADNKRFCVRMLDSAEYRNHVVIVFEYQQMNLREAIRKFGKDVGINIGAVRLYARQLLVALKHLADLRIVHADIKPDNILVSSDLKQVRLCDFGSAFRETGSTSHIHRRLLG